jgi:hypothetical protein
VPGVKVRAAIPHKLKLLEPLIAAWDEPSSNWGFYEPAEFAGCPQGCGIPASSSCRATATITLISLSSACPSPDSSLAHLSLLPIPSFLQPNYSWVVPDACGGWILIIILRVLTGPTFLSSISVCLKFYCATLMAEINMRGKIHQPFLGTGDKAGYFVLSTRVYREIYGLLSS